MQKQVIAVLGGDKRMDFAARELVRLGYDVREWGRRDGDDATVFSKIAKEWLADVDVLMLPLPTSLDGTHLSTPMCGGGEKLRMETLFWAAPDKLWLVGRSSESLMLRAEREGIQTVDYFENEILQLKNAIPTAEGAIEIAMRELPVVLDGTKVSVIGYGRIGEVLAQKLEALGAEITVWARRLEVCVRAQGLGCKAEQIKGEEFLRFDANTRVIFNTVPSRILTRAVLQTLGKECIIIDLASAPGGVDLVAAKELGIPTIWATALPGKCAPESAGIILGETVHSILLDAQQRSDFLREETR